VRVARLPRVAALRCTCAGEAHGERVASSKLDMNDAKAYHSKLLKRQFFGACAAWPPSRACPALMQSVL